MIKIMNDPGHGGRDPGATGNGYKEKDLVLKLALDVDKELKRHNLKSYMTRRDDRYLPLEARSKKANDLKVDAFISYHFNSFTLTTATGTETFHYPSSKSGLKLATGIQNKLVNSGLVRSNRGVKSANFSVLRRTKMPSALLETCFISNKEDMDFFIKNYDKYVQAIVQAIVEYCGIKYVAPNQSVTTPTKPSIKVVKDKINILLIAEHVAVNGFIKKGVSYVEVNDSYLAARQIFESMGLKVEWDNELGVITADTSSDYKAPEGSTRVLLLGNTIDVKLHMYKGKNCLKIEGAYVPIRDIFESLGFEVEWNRAENMILINK